MGLAAPLATAMCNGSAALQTLTYISIGFLDDLIYAEDNIGVDHNMLLIGGVFARSGSAVLEPVTACCGCSRSIRTLATKCCHNVRQGKSAWMQIVAAFAGYGDEPDWRISEERLPGHAGLGTRRNSGFTGNLQRITRSRRDIRPVPSFFGNMTRS